jgi:iron complex outermembrane recepter protein
MRLLCRLMLAAVATSAAAPLEAQPVAAEAALEPVVVTATRSERPLLDVPASVEVIDARTLRDAKLRLNLSETLGRVAGLTILDRSNYAQDLQLSIRGFGARAGFGVRGVRLLVDGVPATSPDGQGQVSHFPLGAAERIEVLRGPFSALYGNSSGGVIALTSELAPQPAQFTPNGAVGSFGTWRAAINAVGGTDGRAYAIDVGRFSTEGFRAHSGARRDTINLRAAFLDSPLGRVRMSLNAVDMPQTQDPLGLTRAQFDADPAQVAEEALLFDTRKSTRQATFGAATEAAIAGNATLNASAWLGTRSVTQFQAIPVAAQLNPRQPGGVVDFDRVFGGADLRATWTFDAVTASLGISAERLDEDRRGYENFVGTDIGVQGRLRRDETNLISSFDPYAQVEWQPGERWRLHAGVRASRVRFESRDHYIVGINGDDSGEQSYAALNPTVGIVYRPSAALAWYASYGRGFETPTLNELAYRPDGSAGFNTDLQPARSNNVEVGMKFVAEPALRATLALFAIETKDDLVVLTNVGGRSSFANVARTRRDGVEASLDWRPAPAWSVYLSAAYLNARFDTDFLACGPAPCTVPDVPVAAGARLPGVPARTLFAELRHRSGWADLTAEWRAQSALVVNDANTDRAAGYGVLNLAAARSFDLGGRRARVFLRVNNVLDRTYAGSVIVNEGNGRFFEPAPGASGLIGIDLTL